VTWSCQLYLHSLTFLHLKHGLHTVVLFRGYTGQSFLLRYLSVPTSPKYVLLGER
jgi:hypothetical protein